MLAANDDSANRTTLVRRLIYVVAALMLATFAAVALFFSSSAAAAQRSAKAKHDFQAAHPCPANGKKKGSCPGYVIDHVKPLCAGGPDKPANMQWQTIREAKIKDREERKMCSRHAPQRI